MAVDAQSASQCSRKVTDSCPSGHELVKCRYVEGYQCRQCSAMSFQPNENRITDRCRLRRVCGKPHMRYKDHGSTTRDADCECNEGFHFENVDQRACVPNRECRKGYGQGEYGVCVKCIDQGMYSDTTDRIHKCKPLTNCEKEGRCTDVSSNGTFDNVCGAKVKDIASCDKAHPATSRDVTDPRFIIIGGIVGSILLLILLLVIFFVVRRSSLRRGRFARKPLSQEQLEELKLKVVKECEREPALCKKVLSKSVFVVEERIERQIWTLAQELYRSHPIQGKYELIVEKYKESQHKYAVNGYMQEWKVWHGETKDSVGELFHCLRQCKRDDIIYEICNGLRQDVGFEVDMEAQLEEGVASNSGKQRFVNDFMEVFCPCATTSSKAKPASPQCKAKVVLVEKEKQKDKEASGKLLDSDVDAHTAGALYRSRPSPSAPAMDDGPGPDDAVFMEAQLAVHRQCSQPVQATS